LLHGNLFAVCMALIAIIVLIKFFI
jgi:hypothetical protein